MYSQSLLELLDVYMATNRRIRSESTREQYRIAMRLFCRAINTPVPTIGHLTDDHLVVFEKYLEQKRYSAQTINHTTKRLKALWRWCAKKKIVDTWPTLERLPVDPPFRRAWTVQQLQQLMEACHRFAGEYSCVPANLFWVAWHRVQWDTGERTGAMLALRWEWLSDRGLDVPHEVRKGRKPAFYKLSQHTIDALQAIRFPRREMIFEWSRDRSSFYLHYTKLLKLARLPHDRKCKPQRVRRSHLTYWHIAGQDATERAQHASPDVTATHYLDETLFCHVDPSQVLPAIDQVTRQAKGA